MLETQIKEDNLMKTIGIIGAMDEEVSYLKSLLEMVSVKNILGMDFAIGKMASKSVVIVRSGIGKVNAAICAQVLVDMYGVDYIINTGVAGALGKGISVGDIVISKDLVHHDFDSTAFGGYEPGEIPRLNKVFFEADEDLIEIALKASAEAAPNSKAYTGRIASGDQFISSNEQKEKIISRFKPLCVEMEGAAIAQTAYLNKIPFIVIRAMSDSSEDGAAASYEKNKDFVAKVCAEIVEKMIAEI
jgi:adenosylhomocysteine nucleosidase